MAARPPVCGYTCDEATCRRRGEHHCTPRADHVVKFFAELLLHTKGQWRSRRFVPEPWQEQDILRPLFGTVRWDEESQSYVRRYRVAWIELARKNGKSELLAGIALYLLIGDGEDGAEVYGCACDIEQARKVFDVALWMVKLSASLRRYITAKEHNKRLVYEARGSYYEVLPADAAGNLGHNPHGILFDEIISQRDARLWNAMRTGMGARRQPLMVAATTAGDESAEFARRMHDEMRRVAEQPERAPHVFVFMRNTDEQADPWDESVWPHANPALGRFLSVQALREEAQEARADPLAENAFRQFRLNQWVAQAVRWMPMHLWDACAGEPWLTPDWRRDQLAGREAWAGFDLAAKFDLTAWCVLLPPAGPDEPAELLWRFWLPEEGLSKLDRTTDGQLSRWARDGWITVTEGAVLDYERVYADVQADARHFALRGADCDEWSMWPVIQRIADTAGLDPDTGALTAYRNTYDRMSPGMTDLMGLVRQGQLVHHANPVARWCFEAVEVRKAPYDPNLIRPSKPERGVDNRRIDAVPTAAMAVNAWRSRGDLEPPVSAYEDAGLMIV